MQRVYAGLMLLLLCPLLNEYELFVCRYELRTGKKFC